MKALEQVEHVQERHKAAVRELANLEEKQEQAQAAWESAVVNDDALAEKTAGKVLCQAQDALSAARLRLPLLEQAVNKARRDSLEPHAEETAAILADINQKAEPLARSLLEHYESARENAKQVNMLYKQHADLMKAHLALCQAACPENHHAPIAPVPHDAQFVIVMGQLNATFKPDAEARFRPTAESIFRREKSIPNVTESEPVITEDEETTEGPTNESVDE
jgi:hypothetical protein